ncbi:MAG: hypothetical protein WC843_03710 [Candidatus Gracilibacteria bacterium]|jgi:hypothetical protein
MKKILTIIFAIITLTNFGLAWNLNQAVHAQNTQTSTQNNAEQNATQQNTQSFGSYLQGLISLPDELHPNFAPDVKIATGADGKSLENTKGYEAAYANFFLQLIAGGLLYLAGPVAIAVIAIGGVRYTISHGNETMLEGAKKTLMYGVIGLLIIIFSYAIVKGIVGVVVGI